MKIVGSVRFLFPAEDEIPEEFTLASPVNQIENLINGELRHRNGPMLMCFLQYISKLPQD